MRANPNNPRHRMRMKTIDYIIQESREFVCEQWGKGEASVVFYAPVTRMYGITWIHPTWARECTWGEITARAARIWRVSGSLWNPVAFRLIWRETPDFSTPKEPVALPGSQP